MPTQDAQFGDIIIPGDIIIGPNGSLWRNGSLWPVKIADHSNYIRHDQAVIPREGATLEKIQNSLRSYPDRLANAIDHFTKNVKDDLWGKTAEEVITDHGDIVVAQLMETGKISEKEAVAVAVKYEEAIRAENIQDIELLKHSTAGLDVIREFGESKVAGLINDPAKLQELVTPEMPMHTPAFKLDLNGTVKEGDETYGAQTRLHAEDNIATPFSEKELGESIGLLGDLAKDHLEDSHSFFAKPIAEASDFQQASAAHRQYAERMAQNLGLNSENQEQFIRNYTQRINGLSLEQLTDPAIARGITNDLIDERTALIKANPEKIVQQAKAFRDTHYAPYLEAKEVLKNQLSTLLSERNFGDVPKNLRFDVASEEARMGTVGFTMAEARTGTGSIAINVNSILAAKEPGKLQDEFQRHLAEELNHIIDKKSGTSAKYASYIDSVIEDPAKDKAWADFNRGKGGKAPSAYYKEYGNVATEFLVDVVDMEHTWTKELGSPEAARKRISDTFGPKAIEMLDDFKGQIVKTQSAELEVSPDPDVKKTEAVRNQEEMQAQQHAQHNEQQEQESNSQEEQQQKQQQEQPQRASDQRRQQQQQQEQQSQQRRYNEQQQQRDTDAGFKPPHPETKEANLTRLSKFQDGSLRVGFNPNASDTEIEKYFDKRGVSARDYEIGKVRTSSDGVTVRSVKITNPEINDGIFHVASRNLPAESLSGFSEQENDMAAFNRFTAKNESAQSISEKGWKRNASNFGVTHPNVTTSIHVEAENANRAERVKSDLIRAGVPEEDIRIRPVPNSAAKIVQVYGESIARVEEIRRTGKPIGDEFKPPEADKKPPTPEQKGPENRDTKPNPEPAKAEPRKTPPPMTREEVQARQKFLSNGENYYETLGVARNASKEDINKAFRKKSIEMHPDLNSGDPYKELRFKEINKAHEVLDNDRGGYDRTLNEWEKAGHKGAEGHQAYTDQATGRKGPDGQILKGAEALRRQSAADEVAKNNGFKSESERLAASEQEGRAQAAQARQQAAQKEQADAQKGQPAQEQQQQQQKKQSPPEKNSIDQAQQAQQVKEQQRRQQEHQQRSPNEYHKNDPTTKAAPNITKPQANPQTISSAAPAGNEAVPKQAAVKTDAPKTASTANLALQAPSTIASTLTAASQTKANTPASSTLSNPPAPQQAYATAPIPANDQPLNSKPTTPGTNTTSPATGKTPPAGAITTETAVASIAAPISQAVAAGVTSPNAQTVANAPTTPETHITPMHEPAPKASSLGEGATKGAGTFMSAYNLYSGVQGLKNAQSTTDKLIAGGQLVAGAAGEVLNFAKKDEAAESLGGYVQLATGAIEVGKKVYDTKGDALDKTVAGIDATGHWATNAVPAILSGGLAGEAGGKVWDAYKDKGVSALVDGQTWKDASKETLPSKVVDAAYELQDTKDKINADLEAHVDNKRFDTKGNSDIHAYKNLELQSGELKVKTFRDLKGANPNATPQQIDEFRQKADTVSRDPEALKNFMTQKSSQLASQIQETENNKSFWQKTEDLTNKTLFDGDTPMDLAHTKQRQLKSAQQELQTYSKDFNKPPAGLAPNASQIPAAAATQQLGANPSQVTPAAQPAPAEHPALTALKEARKNDPTIGLPNGTQSDGKTHVDGVPALGSSTTVIAANNNSKMAITARS